jgi:hypothetical protein
MPSKNIAGDVAVDSGFSENKMDGLFEFVKITLCDGLLSEVTFLR